MWMRNMEERPEKSQDSQLPGQGHLGLLTEMPLNPKLTGTVTGCCPWKGHKLSTSEFPTC